MAMNSLHAAIGMAIVKLIPIPYISLPLVFLSHFLLDLYPEWTMGSTGIKNRYDFKSFKPKEKIAIIIQFLLGAGVITTLILLHSWTFLFAAILANLPDMWDYVYKRITGKNFWFVHSGFFPVKLKFSWQGFAMRPLQNSVLDLLFVAIILLLLL